MGAIIFQLPSPLELALGLWLATFAKFGILGSPEGGLGARGGGDTKGSGGGVDLITGYVRLDERGAGFMGCNWGGALGSTIIYEILEGTLQRKDHRRHSPSPFNHTFLAPSSLPFTGLTFSCPNEGPPKARGALPSCGDP